MITDEERREIANELRRQAAYSSGSLGEWWQRLQEIVTGEVDFANPQETYRAIAALIDRPTCHDLVEHKHDPFIPGKRMADGYFHCSSCDWSGQLWEYIGFGGMLAYEPVHCPKCGEKIERVGELVPGA